jgi:hypothetical protein
LRRNAEGLAAKPDVGDNGVHASASPFEALAERMNWLKADMATDPFGAALLDAGIPAKTITAWSVDPQTNFGPTGIKQSLFDTFEDTNAPYNLALATMVAGVHAGAAEQESTSSFSLAVPLAFAAGALLGFAISKMYGARFSTEICARRCHSFQRLLA